MRCGCWYRAWTPHHTTPHPIEVTNDNVGSASVGQVKTTTNEQWRSKSEDGGGTTAIKEETTSPRHNHILNYDPLYALWSPRRCSKQKYYSHEGSNFCCLQTLSKRLVAVRIPSCHRKDIRCVNRCACELLHKTRTYESNIGCGCGFPKGEPFCTRG